MAKVAPDFGDGPAPTRHPNTRPLPAASLIIADISGGQPSFLMGQRSEAHIFMPGFLVFPGGRLERSDYRNRPIDSVDAPRLAKQARSADIGSALLSCALRETTEETGINLGGHKAPFRYIGRAITPPGQVRRYDTRFFLTIAKAAELSGAQVPDDELLRVDWFTVPSMAKDKIHRITALILNVALNRLADDPNLAKDPETPTHRFRYGKPVIEYE